VETGQDEEAIVIGGIDLTEEIAKQCYENRYEIEEGIDNDSLDWEKAKNQLDEARIAYTQIGASGLPALNSVINPSLTISW